MATPTNLAGADGAARQKIILLVEDDRRDAELAMIALGRCDAAGGVALARDGAEALNYLRREGGYSDRHGANPAVVLLDLKLPKVAGVEVLREMRADLELSNIRTVMFTSSREPSDLVRAYDSGASAYVVKPIGFSEYAETVAKLSHFWTRVNMPPPGCARTSS